MAETIREIMTNNPTTLSPDDKVIRAAEIMRDENVGAVLLKKKGKICGIVTDRDIAVRVVAEGKSAKAASLNSICSEQLATLSPDDKIDHAIELMRKKGIRRIPIADKGKPVGILSLGDLAICRDPASALGRISAASPNT